MRILPATAALLAVACGSSSEPINSNPDAAPSSGGLEPPEVGFQLVSDTVTIAAGQETTKCWYFQMPNDADMAVARWESQMTQGSHHMIVYLTEGEQAPPGTISDSCDIISAATGGAVWAYAAQTPYAMQLLPTEVSPPVGVKIKAGQYGFIQMHYLNASDFPLDAQVTLNVHTHAAGAAYTPAAPYITFQGEISIPANSTASFGGSCPVPTDKDFYTISTHAHKQAVHTEIKDGDAMVFESTNWSEPGSRQWQTAPFGRFSSGRIDYRCDYDNPTDRTISVGDSAATDEMCMAVGYMFPAERATLCYNSFVVPL